MLGRNDLPKTDIDRIFELVCSQWRKIKDVSILLGIKPKAIYSVLHRYHHYECVSSESKSNRVGNKPNILTDEYIKFIDEYLAVNCSLTAELLNDKYRVCDECQCFNGSTNLEENGIHTEVDKTCTI